MLGGRWGGSGGGEVCLGLVLYSEIYFKNLWWLVLKQLNRFAETNCLPGCLCQRQFSPSQRHFRLSYWIMSCSGPWDWYRFLLLVSHSPVSLYAGNNYHKTNVLSNLVKGNLPVSFCLWGFSGRQGVCWQKFIMRGFGEWRVTCLQMQLQFSQEMDTKQLKFSWWKLLSKLGSLQLFMVWSSSKFYWQSGGN